jgi:hypothetical protein
VRLRTLRLLTVFAALVLLATSALHATGYSALRREVSASNLELFFRDSLPRIWLFFSGHLVAVSAALGWVSIGGSRSARPLLVFLAGLVCADALFVLWGAGLFVGSALLVVAAVCVVVAATRSGTPQTGRLQRPTSRSRRGDHLEEYPANASATASSIAIEAPFPPGIPFVITENASSSPSRVVA